MPSLRTLALPMAFALFGLGMMVLPAHGQGVHPPTDLSVEDLQDLLSEAEETQRRLAEIHDRVMTTHGDLQERQESLRQRVDDAIRLAEPDYDAHRSRMEELEMEALVAQQLQDGNRLRLLQSEYEYIAGQMEAAQTQAFGTPEVQAGIEAFEADLIEAMTDLDPQTPQLLDRLEELSALLAMAGIG